MAATWNDPLSSPTEQETPCPRCKGTGLDRNEWEDCDNCLGEGTILIPLPEFSQNVNQIPR